MEIAVAIIAVLSGTALIVAEALQPAKSDGFSVITGMASQRFQSGTKEYMMEQVARYSAIVWMIACAAYAYFWYKNHGGA
jgi:protein translocase SecG subunit